VGRLGTIERLKSAHTKGVRHLRRTASLLIRKYEDTQRSKTRWHTSRTMLYLVLLVILTTILACTLTGASDGVANY